MDHLVIRGAREHNLKNISLTLPKNKLIVITGVSGSGKSTLAFDTIYAEGQRRYVESLSSYARQFLDQLAKPEVEHIDGLSPAISIEQRTAVASPRSIVATQTEIYDYLRLLFARVGQPHCYICGRPIIATTSAQIIDTILATNQQKKIHILSPVVRGKKGEYNALFQKLSREGFVRVRVDGTIHDLSESIRIDKYRLHTIEIVVDRLLVTRENRKRIADSVEIALQYSQGAVFIVSEDGGEEFFNTKLACLNCGVFLEELEPRLFSFNSPYGACPLCHGLGTRLEFDVDLIVPDTNRTLRQGAIAPWRKGSRGYMMYHHSLLKATADQLRIDMDAPFKRLPKEARNSILYGNDNIMVWGKPLEGVVPGLMRLFNGTKNAYLKEEITRYMSKLSCPECKGARIKKESLAVYLNGKNIRDIIAMSVDRALDFFSHLPLSAYEERIASRILKEIKRRLIFCRDVGIGYLTLDRLSSTLSGGEAQRIRLATQVGAALSGILYILDEPTIGLHPYDNRKLVQTLCRLRDLANTVIVVEHDEYVIRNSDWIVDLGPGAGEYGGRVIYSGPVKEIAASPSLTGKYLEGVKGILLPSSRRPYHKAHKLFIRGACEHNLKNIDITIPLGVFVCVSGVSGSGKSTLVNDILYRLLAQNIYESRGKPGRYRSCRGLDHIDKVIIVDQSPIGRTPRSNPATYTGVFVYIREVFAKLPEARQRGYTPSRFSFNVAGGRCEACQGEGTKRIEMHFLPDIYVPCQVCKGKRFNAQTLDVRFKGFSIADVLEMNVDRAAELFENFPAIKNTLQTLQDVGLGYITLGQPATTLSGGEAQRMKLAAQLRKRATGKTLYILDEPTTGLHFDDVGKLLTCLQRLVDKKNTVLVIEHNLDVIKSADYIIDLGPGGGDAGGSVVVCGAPEEIIRCKDSHTARFLKFKL